MPGPTTVGWQAPKSGSSIIIEELSPPGPGLSPRTLVLNGSGLPFMGAAWSGQQRVPTTWYAGNTEATQQVLGPKEMPSKWEGFWKRTLLGRTPANYTDEAGVQTDLVSPHVLRDVLEDFARRGARLRVTWHVEGDIIDGPARNLPRQVNAKLVREGALQSWTFTHDRLTDIRWEIEFWWASRGQRQEKVTAAREEADLASVATALEASVNYTIAVINWTIVSIRPNIPKSASIITLGQLEQLAALPSAIVTSYARKLQENINSFKRIGDIVAVAKDQPFAIAQTVSDFATNTMAISNRFLDQMGRAPPERSNLKTRVSSVIRTMNYLARQENAARSNALRAYEMRVRVKHIAATQTVQGALTVKESANTRAGHLIAIHITRQGDTPQRISMKYYGNPDCGDAVLRANKLPVFTPSFRKGTILIIPVMTKALRTGGV